LTIKYVSPTGEENIAESHSVVADRTEGDGRPRVLVFDEIPALHKGNNVGAYVGDLSGSTDAPLKTHNGIVYVMNRFGATVATYRL
jgi:predicted subunit of tRNA(5-methylaminomethyl-2-thiouridylate) methyltransferase